MIQPTVSATPPCETGKMPLTVEVKRAFNLPKMEASAWKVIKGHDFNDAFCELTFNGQTQSTKPRYKIQKPEWNEKLEWTLEAAPSAYDEIEVAIFDHLDSGRHLKMCATTIPLKDVLENGHDNDRQVIFEAASLHKGSYAGAELEPTLVVSLTYKPPLAETLKEKHDTELSKEIEVLRQTVSTVEAALPPKADKSEVDDLKETVRSLEKELRETRAQNEEELTEMRQLINEIIRNAKEDEVERLRKQMIEVIDAVKGALGRNFN